jgi:hypothetical protein
MIMQNTPTQSNTDHDYHAGFARVMWYAERARSHGWHMSERQLVHEIIQRERAVLIRERSNLPIVGQEVRSAAWNRGQAEALREILREQQER